jgi:hypothetical protein
LGAWRYAHCGDHAPDAPRHAREALQVFAIEADHEVTPDGVGKNNLKEQACGGEFSLRLERPVGRHVIVGEIT